MTINFFVNCYMKFKKEHLGEKLKKIRVLHGMSQEDLAKAIGKTRSLISHLETSGNINKYTLQEIATALKIETTAIENFNYENVNILPDHNPKTEYNKDEIQRLKEEITDLKATVKEQWKIIQNLTKGTKATSKKA
jgi:transcriptional regulator with XRE-family HTH domain